MNGGLARSRGSAFGRGLATALSLALCLAGIGAIGQGISVPIRAEIAQYSLERAFERELAANRAEESEAPVPQRPRMSQAAVHRPKGGPVARISVPRLGIREIVLGGDATHEKLALGPTMLKRAKPASPVTILAAHRDTHFLFIRDLREGDEVILQFVNGQTQRYRITGFETVRWDEFAYPLDPLHPLLALTTCFPFGGTEYGGPLRRVAWAERIV